MKRYQFTLETLLRVRRAQETAARQSLARAQASAHAARRRREAARRRYEASVRDEVPGTTLDALRRERSRLTIAAEVLAHAESVLGAALAARADAEQVWATAAERVAVLDRLEAKGRAEHHVLARRRQVAAYDEIAAARVARAVMAGAHESAGETPA